MATTSLGPVLTGPNGLTLYTHTGDTATSSTCTGSCATAWPPLTVAAGAMASAGTGVTGTLATLTRADGSIQVTYNGQPLYGWKNDAKPGDVTGQGVGGFSVAKP
jgi:predicted lipoprotein with Yx(FWY)xxD motif